MDGVCHLKARRKILIHRRWSIRRRVRLSSGICSRNLFIPFLVFMVYGIRGKEEGSGGAAATVSSQPRSNIVLLRAAAHLQRTSVPLLRSPSLCSIPFLYLPFSFNSLSLSLSLSLSVLLSTERASSDCKLTGISRKEILAVPSFASRAVARESCNIIPRLCSVISPTRGYARRRK